jgi:demethylspheroidene O-methyltransferase
LRLGPDGRQAVSSQTLSDHVLRARDHLLASPRFQQAALSNPLLRRISRRRAAKLFDLCAGFVYSQVLFACVELRVFDQLRRGPRSLQSLAQACDLSVPAMRTLLHAAQSLQLVQRRSGKERFGLGIHGAALLGNPGLLPMIAHHRLFYADLADPVALLRGTHPRSRLAGYWPYATDEHPERLTDEKVSQYSTLMATSQGLVGDEILDAYSLKSHRCLLDVGGGDGTFCLMAAERFPRLRVVCFDLPAVAQLAREQFRCQGLGARANAVGGSFLQDELPSGADIICLIRVLHDHDDHAAMKILRAARAALPRDGAILIAEPLADTPGGQRTATAYFGFYFLAMSSGRARAAGELAQMLAQAGFAQPRSFPTRLPMNVRVLVARCDAAKC